MQASFAHQRPTALAVADEVDDENARLIERRKLELAPCTPQRRLLVLVDLLLVGDQPVEVDVGVDLGQLAAIEVSRIDLEDLDDQRLDVLDVQVERDRLIGRERLLVGHREIEIDPLFQRLVLRGRQHGVPSLGIADAAYDLYLGKVVLQIEVIDVRLIGLRVGVVDEEVMQVAADQRLVVADRRQ